MTAGTAVAWATITRNNRNNEDLSARMFAILFMVMFVLIWVMWTASMAAAQDPSGAAEAKRIAKAYELTFKDLHGKNSDISASCQYTNVGMQFQQYTMSCVVTMPAGHKFREYIDFKQEMLGASQVIAERYGQRFIATAIAGGGTIAQYSYDDTFGFVVNEFWP